MRRLLAIVAFCLASQARAEDAPAPLKCLSRWYPVVPFTEGGRWYLLIFDKTVLPYDDGRKKTFEEKLDDPDVKDAFSQRYTPGPIKPVSEVDFDPGGSGWTRYSKRPTAR